MIRMKKIIENGYINFSDEVKQNIKERIRNGYGKTTTWGAIIIKYDTLKYIKRKYFDFKNDEIEITHIKKGDVLNIRKEVKICYIYSFVCDEYYLIVNIINDQIMIENYPSIAKAISAQKKYFFVQRSLLLPIPKKSK
jgi:hypothetical protein